MNKIINFNHYIYFKKNFYFNFYFLKLIKGIWSNFFKDSCNILVLEVLLCSCKKDIKYIIESIFNIKVIYVNTLIKKFKFKNKKQIKKKKAFIKFVNYNIVNKNVFD